MAIFKRGKSSERAKKGTSDQVEGIIKTLEDNLKSYEEEKTLYKDPQMLKVIDSNIARTKKALEEYKALRDEYKKQGLI